MATQKIKKEKEMVLCLGHNSPILQCAGMKGISTFYDSWSPFSKGKVPYCKDCVIKMIQYFIKNGCNMQTTVYYVCQKLDVPFIMEVWEKVNEQIKKK